MKIWASRNRGLMDGVVRVWAGRPVPAKTDGTETIWVPRRRARDAMGDWADRLFDMDAEEFREKFGLWVGRGTARKGELTLAFLPAGAGRGRGRKTEKKSRRGADLA